MTTNDIPLYDGPSYKTLLEQKLCMYKTCRAEGQIYKETLVPVVLCEKHKQFRINGKLKP